MNQVLGTSIMGKKVVSQTGLELGHVLDVDFELDGTINYVTVKPEKVSRGASQHLTERDLFEIPYSAVKAIGEYVVADFPQK